MPQWKTKSGQYNVSKENNRKLPIYHNEDKFNMKARGRYETSYQLKHERRQAGEAGILLSEEEKSTSSPLSCIVWQITDHCYHAEAQVQVCDRNGRICDVVDFKFRWRYEMKVKGKTCVAQRQHIVNTSKCDIKGTGDAMTSLSIDSASYTNKNKSVSMVHSWSPLYTDSLLEDFPLNSTLSMNGYCTCNNYSPNVIKYC